MSICKGKNFIPVWTLNRLNNSVALFQLLLAAHTQICRSDFLSISALGNKYRNRIIGYFCFCFNNFIRNIVKNFGMSAGIILINNTLKLGNNDFLHSCFAWKYGFKFGNIILKIFYILDSFQNILSVKMTKFDFSNIFSLYFVNSKANHKVWNNLRFTFCFSDYFNCLINIKQNFWKSL